MGSPKNINRKAFLSSAVTGIAALSFGGCGDDTDDPTGGSGGSLSGGASTGGSGGTSGRSSGGASTGGASTGGAASGGRSSGGASTDGTTGGAATGGASTGGEPGDGGASGGLGGVQNTGGTGGDEEYMCTSNTDNGTHSHPLTVPGGDVERGYQDEPYLLEDGGTGHSHTLLLSAYDFLYLSAGATIEVDSSEDNGHRHPCIVSCTLG